MLTRALLLVVLAASSSARADPLSEAFPEGGQFGRAGNAAARQQVTGEAARSTVPNYTESPSETNLYSPGGLGEAIGAAVGECALTTGQGSSYADQSCNAINFSQTNPGQRPSFTISPNDPLVARSKTIANDPQAIAGNLAGTYGGCTTRTIATPDIFETRVCNEYRTPETQTCSKVLTVTPYHTPGCSPGQFLTRVTANPCPRCIDYLAYDFTCGAGNYLMHAFTILKSNGATYMDLGSQYVPGTLDTSIPQTQGPSRIDGWFCYQTYYSQSCSGASCAIGAWFYNPCQGTSYYGVSNFVMPTTVAFKDSWDNQCATLEARAQ
jgi:hypothetical protein